MSSNPCKRDPRWRVQHLAYVLIFEIILFILPQRLFVIYSYIGFMLINTVFKVNQWNKINYLNYNTAKFNSRESSSFFVRRWIFSLVSYRQPVISINRDKYGK
jgi:hypothetical protein